MVSCPALLIRFSPDPLGLNGKCQTFKLGGWLFLEERAPKKGGETTWRARSFSLVKCNLKEPESWTFWEKQVALRLEDKKQIVSEVSEIAQSAVSAVLVDYRGLSVADMTGIRSRARESGVYLRVVRNTLAKRAVEGTDFECLSNVLVGPSLLAFSSGEPGAAARLIRDCAKDLEQLEVRAISMGGSLLGPESLESVASLPSLDEARASLLALMQAPITKLVATMNEVPSKLVRTVDAVKSGKGT